MKTTVVPARLQFAVFGTLAIRVRGKILIEWLVILLRFRMRPRIYIFTKNDLTHREADIIPVTEEKKAVTKEMEAKKELRNTVSLEDQAMIEKVLFNPSLKFRFGLGKKGGIDVSVVASED
jgi:hypothetical protein